MIDIIEECERHGVDQERLTACLSRTDNWAGMVHSFEYLTVLGIVESAMRQRKEQAALEEQEVNNAITALGGSRERRKLQPKDPSTAFSTIQR